MTVIFDAPVAGSRLKTFYTIHPVSIVLFVYQKTRDVCYCVFQFQKGNDRDHGFKEKKSFYSKNWAKTVFIVCLMSSYD